MRIAGSFLWDNRDGNKTAIRTVQCCFDTIFELYRRKQASPKDVTEDGESLMHGMSYIIAISPPIVADKAFQMATKLLACGVPVTTYNIFGHTPAIALLHYHYSDIGSVIGLAKRLLPEPDIPVVQKSQTWSLPTERFLYGCLEALDFAEGSNNLFQALWPFRMLY
jgi:hypothetical protein